MPAFLSFHQILKRQNLPLCFISGTNWQIGRLEFPFKVKQSLRWLQSEWIRMTVAKTSLAISEYQNCHIRFILHICNAYYAYMINYVPSLANTCFFTDFGSDICSKSKSDHLRRIETFLQRFCCCWHFCFSGTFAQFGPMHVSSLKMLPLHNHDQLTNMMKNVNPYDQGVWDGPRWSQLLLEPGGGLHHLNW